MTPAASTVFGNYSASMIMNFLALYLVEKPETFTLYNSQSEKLETLVENLLNDSVVLEEENAINDSMLIKMHSDQKFQPFFSVLWDHIHKAFIANS